ncbi:hypothetical protein PQX77_000931 [Marasmius sp. AFHP31]|nr:hypothetical protein PQX77_000931 [Marasmius sp. AFHP31]
MDRIRSWKTISLLTSCLISLAPVNAQAWNESSWVTMQPSKDLQWVECYPGGFQCTRFQVPLNYSEPDGESAAIALIRLPANVSADSPEYRGPILFNPGGPGGSGVDQIVAEGTQFQAVFPQWDIVGFDPRGVSRSTPQISFYKDIVEYISLPLPAMELNHSSSSVESYWAMSKALGAAAFGRNGDVLRHMNTENVARDMLAITEAHNREKLQYIGVSYGSILGATFAALFPDKVERLVIDGVADVQNDYYTTKWLTSVIDMDKTLQWFFKSCHEAGPDSCAFHESSVEAISSKYNKLYDTLINAPIPVQAGESYQLVDYTLLRRTMVKQLYTPFLTWPKLAAALDALVNGNATAFLEFASPTSFANATDAAEPTDQGFVKHPEDMTAYICNDGEFVPPELEEAYRHYQEMTEVSSFGSIWASWRLICSGWSRSIPKAFRGPISGNTSFPLLLVGNTADPVTPLAGARAVASGFPGSVVLQRDAPGHTYSILAFPSKCTVEATVAYFLNGTLPEEGTICPLDTPPFAALEGV